MGITTQMSLNFYLLLLIQVIIIGWFSYSWISAYQRETNINYMQVTNSGLMQQINYIRTYYENESEKILSNDTIQDILVRNINATLGSAIVLDLSTVGNLLHDPTDTFNIVIAQKNGIIYQPYSSRYIGTTYSQIITTKAYAKSLESYSNVWLAVNENMMNNKKEPYLYLCRTLKSLETKSRVLGQLMIQIPIDTLSDIFKTSRLKSGEYYALVDNDGNFIYNTENMNKIGERADETSLSIISQNGDGWRIIDQNKDKYLISYSKHPGNGWSVLHVLPMRYISANAKAVRNYIILIMLISLLVFLPILVLRSRSLSKPIRNLNTTVEKFGKGDLSIREPIDRLDEIGHLQISFNKMADDINSLLSRITDEHKQRRLLELNILEYQINPHFLYNSFDSINMMAKVAGNKDIEDMVCALARYLRVGLSKGKEFYEVRHELEHVRQYLLINMIRFKDCFTFDIEADPDVLECMTIKIILQPLVENAIKYGINKKNSTGFIKISARIDGGAVLFEITDNGPGIPKERLATLRSLLNDHTLESDGDNGFGLYNVNQRIWLHFGDGYGIEFDEQTQTGTTVRVKVPCIKHADH